MFNYYSIVFHVQKDNQVHIITVYLVSVLVKHISYIVITNMLCLVCNYRTEPQLSIQPDDTSQDNIR